MKTQIKNEAQRVVDRDSVTIRFAGDSGDGMQLSGNQFTATSSVFGNDVSTFPDFPAEIRAPAGTVAGVSGFQLQFANRDIFTAGDRADCLIAMNPAALKAALSDAVEGALVILNIDAFTPAALRKAGYDSDPLEDGTLDRFQVHKVPITSATLRALEELDIDHQAAGRCKNFFALGLTYWLFGRPIETTMKWIESKFAGQPVIAEANRKALLAGHVFGENSEIFSVRYEILRAELPPGTYRHISGNEATALGLIAAAQSLGKQLHYASYPITPASDILHALSQQNAFNTITFQAEDEIAAVCSAIGASFAGAIGVTGTSGPGLCLKSEGIGLAVITELPLIVLNIQRGGPSTGLPTKTEQADLLQSFFGRNGESPLPIVAPGSPGDAFQMAYEAVRMAVRAMTPVIFLSDGYIGNGAEPWKIPSAADLPPIKAGHPLNGAETFEPYLRDETTLARAWAVPGTQGLQHRIGGLEKEDITGNVCYDPENHHKMTQIRAEKIARLADIIPDQEVYGPENGDLLILGWGGTFGSIRGAVERLRFEGRSVAHGHIRYLNPFPKNLESLMKRYKRILLPELNMGQLSWILRAKFSVELETLNLVRGIPFKIEEIYEKSISILEGSEK